ncbi:hypothetical protein CAPTEDRAFT_144257 [Capitella teleta]|uniref:BTB domain-containing protein n=1 Tax=Capitella teleta TaxID=283909 RepID=R7V890_CAPTE|nr:hypothetical protein CAPTEDRAFT_144257 [Capitella teleta]|eukprot:ELU11985.1 hypothetical protein CAPTEDRAFT_144257 [Capitella teleta]
MESTHSSAIRHTSPDHSKLLLSNLHNLYVAQDFCDIQVCVGDQVFHSHRNVLSAASSYFHAMFSGGLAEMNKEKVFIQGVDGNIFKIILEYIYSGVVLIEDITVQDLLAAADMLGLEGIVGACCSFLRQQLHPSNCIGISLYAEKHACDQLKSAAQHFIENNFSKVSQEEEFCSLSKDLLVSFLHSESLVVENEYQVFTAAMQWMLSDASQRRKHVFEVLAAIRFPLISQRQLETYIESCSDLSLKVALRKLTQDFRFDRRLPYELKTGRLKPYLFQPRKSARKNVYVIGGYTRDQGGRWSDSQSLCTVECFNTFHEQWRCIPPLRHSRSGHGVVQLHGLIYVIGGESDSLIFDNMECLDPTTNKWTMLPSMMLPRCGLGACVFEDSILVFGGWVGSEIGDTIEKYDPGLNVWSELGQMETVRYAMNVLEHQGLIYVVGGMSDMGTEMQAVESFNPVTRDWIPLASMQIKRAYAGIACLEDCLYVVGGWNEHFGALCTVERYDIEKNSWSLVTPMSTARAGASVCAVNGFLYVIGGRTSSGEFTAPSTLNSVECYDPHMDTWVMMGAMPSSRCEAGIAVM